MWKLAEDTIDSDDLSALADWLLSSPRLTAGPRVHEFEAAWSTWLGTRNSVFVSSGSTANFALTAVVKEKMAREVPRIGVSAVTWSTNVTPALLLGCEVVVFDVNPTTLGVDPEQVCASIRRGEIDALFVTHALGFNALTPDIVQTAAEFGVILLEDTCEAHGAQYEDVRAGTVGLGSTFSFYFGHHMSTIEGGMVCTDDDGVADELRLMRAHGLARESSRAAEFQAISPEIDGQFLFVSAGLNFRSSDLNAVLGLRQLKGLDERIAQRNTNLRVFLDALPGAYWNEYESSGASSFALPLIARDEAAWHAAKRAARRMDVESRPMIAGNLLRQPFMRKHRQQIRAKETPNADIVHARGMYVGNGHHVNGRMIESFIETLDDELSLRR